MLTIEQLSSLIRIYSKIYYEGLDKLEVDGDEYLPISDHKFDELVDQLSELDPTNELITTTGFDYQQSSKNRENHTYYPVKGISFKTKTMNFTKNLTEDYYVITPKLDGTSIISDFDNGELVRSLTRGNGYSGINITDIMSQIPTHTDGISTSGKITIRGELINISTDKNTRNQSNGLVMRKNSKLTEEEKSGTIFIPYQIMSESHLKNNELYKLVGMGFLTIPHLVVPKTDLVKLESFDEIINKLKYIVINSNEVELPIDGLIIEPYGVHSSTNEDTTAYYLPRIAYKLDSTDSVITEVVGINWKLSQYGKYFPVVKVGTVVIDGSNVSKVSGASYSDLLERGIGIGSKVLVAKSGGIIPIILEVLEKSSVLDEPTDSVRKGAFLFKDGFSIDESRLVFNIFNRFVPDGYGKDLWVRFKNSYPDSVESLSSFRLLVENYVPTRTDFLTTTKQLDALSELFNKVLNTKKHVKFILSLSSLNGLGIKYLNKLNSEFSSIDELYNSDELVKVTNKTIYQSLMDCKSNVLAMDGFFSSHDYLDTEQVRTLPYSVANESLPKVVLTNLKGSSMTKSQIMDKFKDKFLFTTDVKNCDLLVYGIEGSSKHKLASSLGKNTIQVEEFISSN